MQIRCNFPDISYLSETQKNNFQFLNEMMSRFIVKSRRFHIKNAIANIILKSYDKYNLTFVLMYTEGKKFSNYL